MADKNNSKNQQDARVKTVPNSEIIEKSILCAIMRDNEVAPDIFAKVKDTDFYAPRHQELYRNLLARYKDGATYDPIGVISGITEEALSKCGGDQYIMDVAGFEYSSATYEDDVTTLKDLANLRRILKVTDIVQNRVYNNEKADDIISYTQDEFFNLKSANETRELKAVKTESDKVMQNIYNAFAHKVESRALPTGFSILDNYANGGFYPAQMLVLAARPGCGKTSFAMNIVANVARQDPDKVIAVFSLEMSLEQLIIRLYANESKVNSKLITNAEKLTDSQLDLVQKAQKVFNNTHIFIDDTPGITMNEIALKVRRLKSKLDRLDLIVIDHMQLISDSSSRSRSRYEMMTDISRMIKVMAKEVGVPVLVLSQMSRMYEQDETQSANRDEKPKQRLPKMSDLRESGAIEQDADMVMFLTDGDFEVADDARAIGLYIAKNRSGETDVMCNYEWTPGEMSFREIAHPKPLQAKKEEETKNSDMAQVSSQPEYTTEYYGDPEEPVNRYDDIPFNGEFMENLAANANGENSDM